MTFQMLLKRCMNLVRKNKSTYDFYLGFRRKLNTIQPVFNFLDKVYFDLNNVDPDYNISIVLDLKKAFDTVSLARAPLLSKRVPASSGKNVACAKYFLFYNF